MFECRIGHYKRLLQWSSNQPGPQNTCGPSAPSGLRMKTMINSFGMNSFFRLTGICCFSLKAQVGKDQPMEQHAATSVYQNQTIFDSNRSPPTPALWLLRLVGFRSLIFFRTVSLRVFFLGWFLWILWPPGFLRGVRCFLTLVKELLQVPGTTGGWKKRIKPFFCVSMTVRNRSNSKWRFDMIISIPTEDMGWMVCSWSSSRKPLLSSTLNAFVAKLNFELRWNEENIHRSGWLGFVKYPDGQDIVFETMLFSCSNWGSLRQSGRFHLFLSFVVEP